MTQLVAMLNIQQTLCIMSPCLKRLLPPCTLGFIHTWASTSVIASTIGLKFPVLSANRILFLSKKVFQSNANRPLSESPCFIVNKSEHMRRGWAGPCTMRSQMNKFKPVWRWGQDPVLGGGWVLHREIPSVSHPPPRTDKKTRLKTSSSTISLAGGKYVKSLVWLTIFPCYIFQCGLLPERRTNVEYAPRRSSRSTSWR